MPRRTLAFLLLLVALVGCCKNETASPRVVSLNDEPLVQDLPAAAFRTHYLIDYEYLFDKETLFATMGHLLVFNPGKRDAELRITIYFEDREPQTLSLTVPAKKSQETNYTSWPVKPDMRFALKVTSSEPVVCQATIGWINAGNDWSPGAKTKSPHGVREVAKSYMASNQLSKEWYVADGIVINRNDLWIKESEWALILNPAEQSAQVKLLLYYEEKTDVYEVVVPPKRVKRVFMDDLATPNRHYGVRFLSDQPIVAQWLRAVNWYDSRELMTFWSTPGIPQPDPSRKKED